MELLPIHEVLPEIGEALAGNTRLVISAPPGAGKSTVVPAYLAHLPLGRTGRILMLEPRRAAARLLARRIQESSGTATGYRVRHESTVRNDTVIEVVTEGILPGMLRRDMELSGVAAVIFDEFHERNLYTDLSLALLLEIQETLRPDLRIIVMSATLDAGRLSDFLDAPAIQSSGRMFPVETIYSERPTDPRDLARDAARHSLKLLGRVEEGGQLIFLPGAYEIDACVRFLKQAVPPDVDVVPLYGALNASAQDQALRSAPAGRRKIVVATNIAESSVTIPDVRVVIDSGLAKREVYDPSSGLSRLATGMIARSNAEQRRGRAGRCAPGVCLRMYSASDERAMMEYQTPEILDQELSFPALVLADWGSTPERLRWLDPPPNGAFDAARTFLTESGALHQGAITPLGRRILDFPAHPRLGAMMLQAGSFGPLAAEIAAMLELRGGGRADDLRTLLIDARRHPPFGFVAARDQMLRLIRSSYCEQDVHQAGCLLARGFPEWIARLRQAHTRDYLTAGGRGAQLAPKSPLEGSEFLVAARLDGGEANARIQCAAPIDRATLERDFPDRFHTRCKIAFDEAKRAVTARQERCFGEIVLSSTALETPDQELASQELARAVRLFGGVAVLALSKPAELLRRRIRFAGGEDPDWPDLSDDGLLDRMTSILLNFAPGTRSFAELRRLDWSMILTSQLTYEQQRTLEKRCPEYFLTRTKRKLRIDYEPQIPTVSARIQDFYGCDEHPSAAGRPLRLELLNPAGRPVQITLNLPEFWRGSWALVRKELRGRYPKHPWPEEPQYFIADSPR